MAIQFRKKVDMRYAHGYVSGVAAVIASGSIKNFDYFPNTAGVGDSIMFQQSYHAGKQYGAVHFDVAIAFSAASVTGVWEYSRRTGGTLTAPSWTALSNVRDDTNGFQNTGPNAVFFKIPDDWENYIQPWGNSQYYCFNIRYRITAISGVTEGGRQHTTNQVQATDHSIDMDGAETNTSLYAADKAGTVNMDTRTGITTTDGSARTFEQVLRPADYRVLGGADVYITVENWIGTTATIRLTGTDYDGSAQTEDVVVTANGQTNTTKVWRTMTASQVTVATVTSFDYTVTQGQWGVIWKQEQQYMYKCTLTDSAGTSTFTTTLEQIHFFQNYQTNDFLGTWLIGSIYSGAKVNNGTDILFNSINNSLTGGTPWGTANSAFLNCNFRVILAGSSHGYWVPPGGKDGDNITGIFMQGNRQTSFASSENAYVDVTGSAQQVEPALGVVDNFTSFNASYGIRNYAPAGYYFYNCDFTKTITSSINIWLGHRYSLRMRMVDSLKNAQKPDNEQVNWNFNSIPPSYDAFCYFSNTALLQIVDEQGNEIEGATVKIYDGTGALVHESITNQNGYNNLDKGTATGGSVTSLIDTAKSWLLTATTNNMDLDQWWGRYMYITGGTGKGQKRICVKRTGVHTSTVQVPHVDFQTAPDAPSNYVIIPVIDIMKFEPASYPTSGFVYSITTDLNPFTIVVTKTGYENYSEELVVNQKLEKSIQLIKRRHPR